VTDLARITDHLLPPEIAEKMEAAGLPPQMPNLLQIIENFSRLQAEAREKAELERAVEPRKVMWPLKGRLPLHVPYETARRAADAARWSRRRPAAVGSSLTTICKTGLPRPRANAADRPLVLVERHVCFSEVYSARQLARDASHCILTRFGVFIDADLF
jgi:hypothetical protein